jgi:Flp pilus assembly protein TadB
VASDDRKKRGRVTPKKSTTPPPRADRPSILPKRIGPFEKPDPSKPLGQVGRRPSSPIKLFVFFGVYLACGVAAFFVLKGTVSVIVGVVMIGISLFWLRGASTAVLRQQQRREQRDS